MHPLPARRALILLPVLLILLPQTLHAHAILLRSTPAPHATLPGKPFPIELHFNSRVDGPRSRLTLTRTADKTSQHPFPLPALAQPAPDTLTTTAPALPPGDYTLHWLALASDGHISRGELLFSVK